MNLGTLYVQMNGDSKALARSMREGIDAVNNAAKEIKKLGATVAQAGLGMTAFFAGIVKAAAGVDYGVNKSMGRLKDAFLTLAVQIAHMVMPAMNQLAGMLRELADWFAGLPAPTRATISEFAMLAVKFGAVALVVSKVAGLISGLLSILSGVAAVIGAVGAGPIALLVAGLVTLVTVVALLHKAWRTNWNGIRDVVRSVIEQISGWWSEFASFFGAIWGAIVDSAAAKLKILISLFMQAQVHLGNMSQDQAKMMTGAAFSGINTVAGVAKSPMALQTLALKAGNEIKAAGLDIVKEFKIIGKEIRAALGLESHGGKANAVNTSKVGRGGDVEAYSSAIENAIKHSLDKPQRIARLSGTASAGSDVKTASAEFWKGLEELGPMMANVIGPLKAWSAELGNAFLDSMSNVTGALEFGGQLLASKMGELGQVIQSVIQGAQSGGIWGALIALIVEMVSRVARWKEIMDVGMGQMQILLTDLAGPLNNLIDAFKQLMGGIGMLAKALHPIIGFIINLVARVFRHLAPVFAMLGTILEPIGEFFNVIQSLMDAIDSIVPIFKIIGAILSVVAITILFVIGGIGDVWNWIRQKIWELLVALKLEDTALGFSKIGQIDVEAIKDKIRKLGDGIMKGGLSEMADESAAAAESVGKMGEAAKEAAEQLLNVPTGYKVAMSRFLATSATSSSGTGKMDERHKRFLLTGNPVDGSSFPKG